MSIANKSMTMALCRATPSTDFAHPVGNCLFRMHAMLSGLISDANRMGYLATLDVNVSMLVCKREESEIELDNF